MDTLDDEVMFIVVIRTADKRPKAVDQIGSDLLLRLRVQMEATADVYVAERVGKDPYLVRRRGAVKPPKHGPDV